jgi:hypothetical protein
MLGKRGPKLGAGGRPVSKHDPVAEIQRITKKISLARKRGDLNLAKELEELAECKKTDVKQNEKEVKDLSLKDSMLRKENIIIPKIDVAQAWKDPLAVQTFTQISNDPCLTSGTLSNIGTLLLDQSKNKGKNK